MVNDADRYWADVLRDIFEMITINAQKIENQLPPTGYDEIAAILQDADVGLTIVKNILKQEK